MPAPEDARGAAADMPLAGLTVVVTRPREQASGLAGLLAAAGAEVLVAPTIEIVPVPLNDELSEAVAGLGGYDVVVFTSANGVHILFDRVVECDGSPEALGSAELVAIGPATAEALRDHGFTAAVVPEDFVAEGVLEAMARRHGSFEGVSVLIPRAREARTVLPDTLRERGARVDVVVVYDTVAASAGDYPVAAVEAADYVTFTSSSTVKHFVELMGEAGLAERLAGARLASIGPVTSETLRAHGLPVAVEAAAYTADGLAAAIAAHAAGRPSVR